MIEISTRTISEEVKEVNLFLLKNTKTADILKEKLKNHRKIKIFYLNFMEKLLFKIGFLKPKFKLLILKSDIIFIHNVKLIKYVKRIFSKIPLILFFHTDKIKQINKLGSTDRIFTVNNNTKNIINKKFGKKNKAFLLANCIKFNNDKFRIERNKTFTVGSMGRLVEKKGFENLINIFKNLKDINLIIAGDGPLYTKYKKLTKNDENIKLLGWIDDQDAFFSKIDIFVCSSTIEPFGIVILEAMIRGIPVISNNCSGPIDILKNNHDGFLVDKQNIEELRKAIVLLKNNIKLRKRIAKNALATVKNKYSVNMYKKNLFLNISDYL